MESSEEMVMPIGEASDKANELFHEVRKFILGQDDLVIETLCCFLASGHILMTGAPGLAKTTLVKVFASHIGMGFGRIQFTPDLLPADVVGSDILNFSEESGRRSFEFSKGPVFVNLLLADEINRASPRTQSALLEAMQERKVTISGKTYLLPKPFMVLATQNPYDSEGTFPLPEAQLDRFLIHTLVSYPNSESQFEILKAHAEDNLVGEKRALHITPKLSSQSVESLIQAVKRVKVSDAIIQGMSQIIEATRPSHPSCPEHLKKRIWYGAGPRAGISLISICKALALLEKEESVSWLHVRRMIKPVLRHRIRVSASEGFNSEAPDEMVDLILEWFENQNKNLAHGISTF